MNCGNLWMGRIIRLWSVTRSGLESWLSCREGRQAQCKWWLSLVMSLRHRVGMVGRLLNTSTPTSTPLLYQEETFQHVGKYFLSQPWGGCTAAAGPKEGPYVDNSGPPIFPSILRVSCWPGCSRGYRGPLCCSREKVPPSTCQSP